MKLFRIFLIGVVILSLATVSIHTQASNSGIRALPPEAKVEGMDLGQWHSAFWKALLGTPTSDNPFVNLPEKCYFAQTGNVGIGVAGGASGIAHCEMPVGMQLYVLVVGVECSTVEGLGSNEEELKACVQGYPYGSLDASIDGVPVKNLDQYTAFSRLYPVTVPADNPWGFTGPATGYSVARNNGFITTPMTPGKHTIHVHGTIPGVGFDYDWIYDITVKE
jgi:hypothetical protein